MAVIAQDWSDGGKPYLTAWENKPATRYFVRWMNQMPGNPPFAATEANLRANPPDYIFLPNTTEFSGPFGEWLGRAYEEKDNIDGCPVLKKRRA